MIDMEPGNQVVIYRCHGTGAREGKAWLVLRLDRHAIAGTDCYAETWRVRFPGEDVQVLRVIIVPDAAEETK